MHKCVYVTSNLLVYSAVSGGGVSPEGKRNSRFILGTHPLLHAPSSLCPRTLQPWHPNQSWAPGVWHRKSLCPEGNRVGISFLLYLFSPIIWTGVYRWISISWGFWFFLFLLPQTVSLLHGCTYDLLGFFLYRLIQSVEDVSFCYMVGPGPLFYQ